MKTIKTRPGLPPSFVWPLTLLFPSAILWLPFDIFSPVAQLVLSICAVTTAFTVFSLYPRQKIILAHNECQVQTPAKSLRNLDINAMITTTFGRITGIHCNLFEKNHCKPSFGFRVDHIQSQAKSIESLKAVIPNLAAASKTAVFGGFSDILTALLLGVTASGLLRVALALA